MSSKREDTALDNLDRLDLVLELLGQMPQPPIPDDLATEYGTALKAWTDKVRSVARAEVSMTAIWSEDGATFTLSFSDGRCMELTDTEAFRASAAIQSELRQRGSYGTGTS
jgi:hypothetical protein